MKNLPQRIISLAPSSTETLFWLGLGAEVVGITEQCDWPLEAKEKEKIGSFVHPDLQKILSLKPTLVLACERIHDRISEELRGRNIRILVLFYQSVADILHGMEELGRLCEWEDSAFPKVNSLKERINRIRERILGKAKPRVFRLMRQVDSWVITPTSQSYQYDAISIAGGRLMSFSAGEAYARVPLKEVLEFDPEVILSCGRTRSEKPRKRCPGCISQDPPCWWVAEELKDKNGWKETSAAKQDRIYALPCELLCRPGPRVVDGMESIFRLFYLQT